MFNKQLPDDVCDIIEFEKQVFGHITTDSEFDQIKSIIKRINPQWAIKVIVYAQSINFFLIEQCAKLFQLLPCSLSYHFNQDDKFASYLYASGIITDEQFFDSPPQYAKDISTSPFEEDSIWPLIQRDDISMFLSYCSFHNISPYDTNSYTIFVSNQLSEFNIVDFAAFSGASNILKYYILNSYQLEQSSIISAVRGGNEEIISLLASHGYSFEGMHFHAIDSHHNKLAIWLTEQYPKGLDSIHLTDIVQCFNTEMFLHFVNDLKIDINEQDNYIYVSSLMLLSEQNNIILVQYAIKDLHADTQLKDYSHRTALDYATSEEMKEFLRSMK